jgi:hypothetical protein
MFFCQVETAEATNQEHNRQPFNIKSPEGLLVGPEQYRNAVRGCQTVKPISPGFNKSDRQFVNRQSVKAISGDRRWSRRAADPFFTRPNIIFCI